MPHLLFDDPKKRCKHLYVSFVHLSKEILKVKPHQKSKLKFLVATEAMTSNELELSPAQLAP